MTTNKTLWELLWDYDPNGLVAVNHDLDIKVVNPAFCRMFHTSADQALGQKLTTLIPDASDFIQAWEEGSEIKGIEREFPQLNLYVRLVLFSIREQDIIACILVDLTHEFQQKNEMVNMKRETIQQVGQVVDQQMAVAQQIAGLLGETTAETKVMLLKLLEMLERENN